MKKIHEIAFLSMASCFVVAATFCSSSVKRSSNIEASAENLYSERQQVIPLDVSDFGLYDGETLSVAYAPFCFQINPLTREFSLGTYEAFDVKTAYFTTFLTVGEYYFTEYQTPFRTSYVITGSFTTGVDVLLHTTSYNYIDEYSYQLYCLPGNETYNVNYEFYSADTLVLTIEFYYELPDTGWVFTFDMSTIQTDDDEIIESARLPVGNLPFSPYFGYEATYDEVYNDGYAVGRQNGYIDGYADGINNAVDGEGLSWKKLFTSMIDVPINAIRSLFNFEILGYNVSSFLFSLLTIAVVLTVVNLIL